MKLYGAPYPIKKTARGLLATQKDIDVIKADLLILLLTSPGERVMLPDFGTPLQELLFEPNDLSIVDEARDVILESIARWEPRIRVTSLEILNNSNSNISDEQVLYIKLNFTNFENIKEVQELVLELPITGA